MEGTKISFGFKKTKKTDKPVVNEEKEYIECVEEKSIKVIGGESIKDTGPLIIPMTPNTLITAERLKQIAEEVEKGIEDSDPIQEHETKVAEKRIHESETLDQMATRELLEDSKNEKSYETPTVNVPIIDKLAMDGGKESNLDDYESIPVKQFGMAMLRGMGWAPSKEQSKYQQPQLRPKGLGLGADKVIKETQSKNAPKEKNEELSLVKHAFVKILIGKFSGFYGKVISLDEDNGRVLIDITVKKETVSLSEFMLQPVSRSEYDKQSKVINADSYEEYKKKEANNSKQSEKQPSTSRKSMESSNTDHRRDKNVDEHNIQRDSQNSNGRSRDMTPRNRSSSSEDRSRLKKKKAKKKYSSDDSINSLSDSDSRRKDKEYRKHYSTSASDSSDSHRRHKKSKKKSHYSSAKEKRDIDKKRKGKKKRRDRDRSPNHRKHKK